MSRKSLLCGFAFVLLLIGGSAAALAWMVLREPDFYRRASVPAGEQRKQLSTEFREELNNLVNGIINYKSWGARFSEAQINSYFEEDFLRLGSVEKTIFPEGVSSPRLSIESDRLRVAFRYGGKNWSTIVSLDLRIWLAAKVPNVVALEVQQMRVGSLPVALQSILDHFSEAARRQDIEMSWYRHNGNPVAMLRFGPSRGEPTVQLLGIKLQPGTISVRGADRAKPLATEPAPATPEAATATKS
jgi:hypothetical protein